jgi:hypothetical protein
MLHAAENEATENPESQKDDDDSSKVSKQKNPKAK